MSKSMTQNFQLNSSKLPESVLELCLSPLSWVCFKCQTLSLVVFCLVLQGDFQASPGRKRVQTIPWRVHLRNLELTFRESPCPKGCVPFGTAQRPAQPVLCLPSFPAASESSKLLLLLRKVPFLLG